MDAKRLIRRLVLLAVSSSMATGMMGFLPTHVRPQPSLWLPAGVLSNTDKPMGLQAGRRHLWLLVKTPATSTRPSGYRGEAASLTSLSVRAVTPPLPTAGSLNQTAWGRTPGGSWWVAFSGLSTLSNGLPVRVVKTAIWRPGQPTWTQLPSLTFPSSDNGGQAPQTVIVKGKLGHGWLVSRTPAGERTTVYRLNPRGWRKIHTLAYSRPVTGSSFHWAVAGPVGQLFVKPAGADFALWMSASGSIQKTTPIPTLLSKQMQTAFGDAPEVAVSNDRVAYLSSTATGNLWRWVGSRVQSLIGSQSPLAGDVIVWQGVWHNSPVVTAVNSRSLRQMVYVYRDGGWHPAPYLIRYPASAQPLGSHNPAYYSFWSGNTFWTMSPHHVVYVHRVPFRAPQRWR